MSEKFHHVSVMPEETVNGLVTNLSGTYVDCTLGGAGHSRMIADKLNEDGRLIGIDQDTAAIAAATERLTGVKCHVNIVKANFSNLETILREQDAEEIDGILFDLGVSSHQLDTAERGFSYMQDAPLDMRMNQQAEFSAYDIINKYDLDELCRIFKEYGEERYSKSIARKICEERKEKYIETTFELVDIIKSAMPKAALNEKQHPAKRVFQAIRIEVNEELIRLKKTIEDIVSVLNKNGRLAIITFHSLEDKIVKHTFEELEGRCTCPKDFPVCVCGYVSHGKIVTKKPIICSEEELKENPRARSAKLRVFERI